MTLRNARCNVKDKDANCLYSLVKIKLKCCLFKTLNSRNGEFLNAMLVAELILI